MDKYEKVKKIGEGSFGKAILVKSRKDGHQYVIKEIGISRMSNRERQESRKEVAVLANMSHPNIVQYKESFEENGCLYIMMDYCEGGDLFKKINNQKGLLFPEEQILDWFVQICLALKHVHDRKILHRDIKSQNIFLTKDGTVQLGDFGIARVLNSTVELARTCIGTPYYLSPEICENKPYNNKSDIWALGCVLYEMCTLKHAFEAGNMKNLVLNIIRGSYPPVSVHYSQDLRALLGLLFKRNPRERPSVGAILDKPFLARRIHKFLSPQLIAQEFSQSLVKQSKISVAQGVPAKHPVPGSASIPPAQKITKPAAKYGVPFTAKRPANAIRKPADGAKKPVERRPGVKLKQAPLPAAAQRRMNRVEEERRKHEEGVRKKRIELMERERKQREQLNRLNRAREQGWRNVLSSSGGSSPERKFFVGGGMRVPPTPVPVPSPVPGPAYVPPSLPGPVPGSRASGDGIPAKAALDPDMPNGHACLSDHHSVKSQARRTSLQNDSVTKNDYANRLRAQVAAERARQVDEFLQRKQEALLNKVRAEGQLGARQNLATIFANRTNSSRGRRPRVNKEEEEYLARLRQIRLQNFNERQQIKARLRGEKYDSECSDSQESCEELELRRKKIEALKAQSKARAAVLKEQLEKKRRDAYEREKKAWEEHLDTRGVKVDIGPLKGAAPPQPDDTPQDAITKATPSSRPTTPAISMTAALKDVGVTASAQNSPMMEDPSKPETSDVQSERKEILCRPSQNLKAYPSKEEDEQETIPVSEPGPAPQPCQPVTDERPQTGGDRRRWETGAPPVLSVAQYTLEDSCSTMAVSQTASSEVSPVCGADRKKWQPGDDPFAVAHQTLEDTSITTTEQTGSEVILMEAWQGEGQRKVWGQTPVSEVLKILKEAELQPLTQCLDNSSIYDHMHTESFNSTSGRSDDPNGVMLGPYPQPSQAIIDQDQEEQAPISHVQAQEQQAVTGQDQDQHTAAICQDHEQVSEYPKTLSDTVVIRSHEVKPESPEKSLPDEKRDEDEVECLVLEEDLPQTSKPPAEVLNAWGQKALQPRPEEGSAIQAEEQSDKKTQGAEDEKQVPSDAAFVKLSCSPAHRRAVALSTISAQSSVEDTSSSVASRSRSVSPLHRHDDALLIGLSTGLFDANNPKMLRTCSLPDLTKIFSSSTEADGASAIVNNLEIEDLEDKEDEQSDTDAYEDEDLRELRASMERLLQQQRSDEEDGMSEGSPPDEDEHARLNGQSSSSPVEGTLKSSAAVEEDNDNPDNSPEEEASNGHDVEDDEEENSEGKLNEEWQSDDSEEEGMSDLEQQDSIFSRLEELRFHLEQAMGFEHLIQAYNKIKAIVEDEDKCIAVGSNMVQSILGPEHQHLYPKILHLVMADGAYEEDNDE
ncbi:serine/threonine-protein kinase Nek1 isoform X1 [Neoarius graeffei]|uniref:serine/threonine-protein kinase Nek1 isoform X1 n=1 Tax=Neoarius graeffei TaxID=443677 RepID=UPI00298C8B82|nr:serine/threonine-protein kinase Nek1 isoform X1 [Neoarius graeffei]XP_060769992.1 serine/threonine-protein kinase Nek1 isoform X1 [Neoarius graeffei]